MKGGKHLIPGSQNTGEDHAIGGKGLISSLNEKEITKNHCLEQQIMDDGNTDTIQPNVTPLRRLGTTDLT